MIQSMTGFGTSSGSEEGANWRWEIKGVNSKALDIKLRLPQGVEHLDAAIRAAVGEAVSRGTLHISLQMDQEAPAHRLTLDESTLAVVLNAARRIEEMSGFAPATVDGLLQTKGVLTIADTTLGEEEQARLDQALLKGFTLALEDFVTARRNEGQRLHKVLAEQLDEMTALAGQAREKAKDILPAHFAQIKDKIRELIGDTMDEERARQEAVILAEGQPVPAFSQAGPRPNSRQAFCLLSGRG